MPAYTDNVPDREEGARQAKEEGGFFELSLFRAVGNVRVALLVLILIVALAAPQRLTSSLAVYTGLIIGVLLTLWTRFAAQWREIHADGGVDIAATIVVLGDVAWLALFVLGTGGVRSPFAALLLVPIIFSCALFGLARITVALTAAIVIAVELVFVLAFGWSADLFWHTTGSIFALLAVTWVATGMSVILERERRTNELVIRYMDEAVLLVDADATIRLANPQIERMVGLPINRIVGLSIDDVPEGDDYEPLRRIGSQVAEVAAHDAPRDVNIPGGRDRDLELRVSTVRVGDTVSRPIAWLIICQDITDLKSLARASASSVRVLSHEIRSPLTTLKTISSVFNEIADQLSDTGTGRLIEVLDSEVDRMLRLARRFLDLASLGEGTAELQFEEIDLREMIERVAGSLRVRAESKDLQFEVECPDDLPHISGDPTRIEDVLHNLGDNAVKYTPAGGSIRVVARSSNGEVAVAVSDTGCGVSPQMQTEIFREFVRDRSTAQAEHTGGDGIGLGLFIARQIVELHGGRIELQSEVGRGSIFTVFLPIDQPPHLPAREPD